MFAGKEIYVTPKTLPKPADMAHIIAANGGTVRQNATVATRCIYMYASVLTTLTHARNRVARILVP